MNNRKQKLRELKNGWDLPQGEKIPLTGRKQRLIRAYELLVLKENEEFENINRGEKKEEVPEQEHIPEKEIFPESEYMPKKVYMPVSESEYMPEKVYMPVSEKAYMPGNEYAQIKEDITEKEEIPKDPNGIFKPPF